MSVKSDSQRYRRARLQRIGRPNLLQLFRRWWTNDECMFHHRWDDKHAATRICTECGRVEVMSHL